MNKPHKHAELIKAWADGAEIQSRKCLSLATNSWGSWCNVENPEWIPHQEYRIKPVTKPDHTDITSVYRNLNYRFEPERLKNTYAIGFAPDYIGDLKLTFDGETGKLKSAEVL